MRANLKRTMVLFFAMALIFSSFIVANAQSYEITDDMVHIQDFFEDEAFVNALNEHMIDTFGYEFVHNYELALNGIYALYSALPRNRAGQTIYPDSFGGMYINSEGNLVVLTVEGSIESDSIDQICSIDGVLNRESAFSYSELQNTFEFLEELFLDNNQAMRNASSIAMSVSRNRIIVELYDYSYEQISLFRQQVLDSPILVFEPRTTVIVLAAYLPNPQNDATKYSDVEIEPMSTTTLNFGSIVGMYQGMNGSLGFRARRGTARGFVTAAHLAPNDDSSRRVWNTATRPPNAHIGTVGISRISVDAAFVETSIPVNNNAIFPNGTNASVLPQYGTIVEGLLVHTIGMTNGFRTGTVVDLNRIVRAACQWRGLFSITTTQVLTDRASGGGDSGGIVFSRTTTQPQIRTYGSTGILVAASIDNPRQGFFVRTTSINQTLGTQLD